LFTIVFADGKEAAVKALREGQAMMPKDGSPGQRSVRATNYTAWVESDVETDIEFEEVVPLVSATAPHTAQRCTSPMHGDRQD
jgi:hypothetical protein